MKSVYLLGFVGVGLRDKRYHQEHGLIILGHVGMSFEGNRQQILGFHPTPEAIARIGDSQAVLSWLRNRNTLDGCLQDDAEIFERSYELSLQNPSLSVWQYDIRLDDNTFERVQSQAITWYNQKRVFPYGLPIKEGQQTWDNCATFPARLGLPIPEPTGYLFVYIATLREQGTLWKP